MSGAVAEARVLRDERTEIRAAVERGHLQHMRGTADGEELRAVVGIFVLIGISIEFPGIILGALGYYLGLTSQDRASRILGIVAVVLNVISIVISGLTAPPQ